MATHNHQVRRFMMLNKKNDKPWLCFTAQQANSTVRLDKVGTPNVVSLETSRDGKVWTPYSWTDNTGDTITLTKVGDKVYWRKQITDTSVSFSSAMLDNLYRFYLQGYIAASGNINSLLKNDCNVQRVYGYSFSNLFYQCDTLLSIPELPAVQVDLYGYFRMFSDCTSIIEVNSLPAIILAPSAYSQMFSGCSSLRTVPKTLPCTNVSRYCYNQMFSRCVSLVTAPELPATVLAENCYFYMFSLCSSLRKAPRLLATTLVSGCYNRMFYLCRNLNSLNVSFSTWLPDSDLATNEWIPNNSEGMLYCPDELDDSIRDNNHIPAGWTVIKQGYFHDGVLYRDEEFTIPSNISSTTAVYEDILTGNRYSSDGTSLTLVNS